MKTILRFFAIMTVLLSAVSVSAQDTYYSIFNYRHPIPDVQLNDHAVDLQKSLFPELYKTRSVNADMYWVTENDSALVDFWHTQGDTILHILRELSGIAWHEKEFDIYLIRNYPTVGTSNPVIIPIGGIKSSQSMEAAQTGNAMTLNLVYQLAHRMLAQAYQPEDSMVLTIAYHPLLRPGPYRRDNMAMLLALNTCQHIIGIDSTNDAYNSAFWRNRTPGRNILDKYFINNWIITPEKTLADWIAEESYNSELVNITRPPRIENAALDNTKRIYVENIPLKGQLGFSVKINESNQLVVDKIDIYRLAYACGLRTDDIIRRVNGKIVRNNKTLVEYILDNLAEGGAILEIIRNGKNTEIIIQPIDIQYFEDELYLEEIYPADSTALPDSTDGY